jgi:methylated-DNA-[protein]-cysteine S-methyltransferase
MKTFHYSVFETPAGAFAVAVDDSGAIAASAFGGVPELGRRLGAGLLREDGAKTAAIRAEVETYFADPRAQFTAPLAAKGTPFQHRVWNALRAIPPGETRSYGQLAAELGSSPRAVGQANGANPVCLIVPCHRVIGSDGSMTGFAFGESIKRFLLEHEKAAVACAAM